MQPEQAHPLGMIPFTLPLLLENSLVFIWLYALCIQAPFGDASLVLSLAGYISNGCEEQVKPL
jgi:hypothetical protein